MNNGERLLRRLDEIAISLEGRPAALALLALGSVGHELERLDEYSDLDFFVIVEVGRKWDFLNDLNWLAAPCPLVYSFRNTVDGYKCLFEDGIFCEFAVFELHELGSIPYAPGRMVWKREGIDETIRNPSRPIPQLSEYNQEWLLGEILTNLYVGLCRFWRGEKLSAARFIQGYAVDRIIELVEQLAEPATASKDRFAPERRIEQHYPQYADWLERFIQGYNLSPASAQSILEFLKLNFSINPAMEAAILKLCHKP